MLCFALLCFSEETIFYEFRKTSFCAKPGLIRQLKRCLRNQRKVCHLWCGAFTAIICVSWPIRIPDSYSLEIVHISGNCTHIWAILYYYVIIFWEEAMEENRRTRSKTLQARREPTTNSTHIELLHCSSQLHSVYFTEVNHN